VYKRQLQTFPTRTGEGGEGSGPLGTLDEDLPDVDPATDMQPPERGIGYYTDVISNWETGYCEELYLTNYGDEPITWSLDIEVTGVVTSNWNSNVSVSGGIATFTGVDWNATLDPGGETKIGYCASR